MPSTAAPRMTPPEDVETGRVEARRVGLAFDRDRRSAAGSPDDEVDLVLLLVAPVEDPVAGEVREQFVQDQVPDQEAAIVVAQRGPVSQVADDARVEGVDLGLGPDLRGARAREWAQRDRREQSTQREALEGHRDRRAAQA